jgi:hypothetical protein
MGKTSPESWATSVIKKNVESKQSPIGENSRNLVTLLATSTFFLLPNEF